MFCIFTVAYFICYVYPNFSSRPAVELPLWWIDRVVPFLPATFIAYTSDYVLILIAILIIDRMDQFLIYARMCFITIFIAGIVYYIFPTTYPRPIYPEVSELWIKLPMALVGAADTPKNCFPSMHVALTTVATWNLRYKGPSLFGLFVVWTGIVYVSTLTTKQHYFADILGGLVVVVMAAFLEWFLFEKGVLRTYLKPSQ
jgi:membrane-associated phospholipid phosphatase